jgi:hypothetical protein
LRKKALVRIAEVFKHYEIYDFQLDYLLRGFARRVRDIVVLFDLNMQEPSHLIQSVHTCD